MVSWPIYFRHNRIKNPSECKAFIHKHYNHCWVVKFCQLNITLDGSRNITLEYLNVFITVEFRSTVLQLKYCILVRTSLAKTNLVKMWLMRFLSVNNKIENPPSISCVFLQRTCCSFGVIFNELWFSQSFFALSALELELFFKVFALVSWVFVATCAI